MKSFDIKFLKVVINLLKTFIMLHFLNNNIKTELQITFHMSGGSTSYFNTGEGKVNIKNELTFD